jgi:hypothetical protein
MLGLLISGCCAIHCLIAAIGSARVLSSLTASPLQPPT